MQIYKINYFTTNEGCKFICYKSKISELNNFTSSLRTSYILRILCYAKCVIQNV